MNNKSFILPIKEEDFPINIKNNSILIDGNLIQNRTDLLNQFYSKFELVDYMGQASLDTFYDIMRDEDFIWGNKVIIFLYNYQNFLPKDQETRDLFFAIFVDLMTKYADIEYKIYISL